MLEVTSQDLKIEMTEKVSFEQLKLLMTGMQDGQNGQQMTIEERERSFD